jgi:hypothetical protein
MIAQFVVEVSPFPASKFIDSKKRREGAETPATRLSESPASWYSSMLV